MQKNIIIGAVTIIAIGAGIYWWTSGAGSAGSGTMPVVSAMHGGADAAAAKPADQIIVPELSQLAKSGEVAFNENCAACHGENAAGTEQGPPLIHSLYRPGHHPDTAFVRAAKTGVRSHHWRFGNMPPVEGITDAKLRWITAYVREMQVANGVK